MKVVKILIHASTWFLPILLPLVVWLLAEEDKLKRLSLQAVVFHIVMTILITVSAFLSFILIGIPFLIVFGVIAFIIPVIGIVRALQDREFEYPIIRSFI
ncbi:hypothetical protein SAMN05444487_11733 [Marininema mesophilum]|uniref:DUF4870 domain-containing protein n=1 Tax=Marininema mesophilum TaxID=1048340 RepID=A0A1H3BMK1_9BACL|nr:hypothetical protein SAMN05444487_11733 [Marininema mesophilum]